MITTSGAGESRCWSGNMGPSRERDISNIALQL